jgi:uncharacterized protein YbjT (DUF2867 family)
MHGRIADAGNEVAAADLNDFASFEQAFADVHGMFGATNLWEHLSLETELDQARDIAEAAHAVQVAPVVWSTLEDTRRIVAADDPRIPTLPGGRRVPRFDADGAANAFFARRQLPTTFLNTSFFRDNLLAFGWARSVTARACWRSRSGSAIGRCPEPPPRTSAHAWRGSSRGAPGPSVRSVGIAGGRLTGAQMARALSAAIGEPVRYQPMRWNTSAARPFPGAADRVNMFRFKHDFCAAYCALRDVAAARHLHPALLGSDAWLARHARQTPVPDLA